MGGLVFANCTNQNGDPVRVPRMSPHLYRTVSEACQTKLEQLFERVVVPRDAPAKVDFGDTDFLVEGIRPHIPHTDIWAITKETLGAELYLARGSSHSFGIVHPTEPNAYVQVDVELSPGNGTTHSAELFEWTRFMKGDSDLLQIIGVSHRPLGLICTDQGLHVRVAEIEPYNKKKAQLFLTRNPNVVMEFYGLDKEKYWAGFEDENNLFEWATSGRFFSPDIFEARVEKHNDRARQAKRPMYRRFVEEFMPAHADQHTKSKSWTRDEVLHEALQTFDKQADYDSMMLEHNQKEAEEELWKDIRSVVPATGNSLGLALKGLRRWVIFEQGHPRLTQQANLDDYVLWVIGMADDTQQELLEWVRQHWQEAKVLEKARAMEAKEAARLG